MNERSKSAAKHPGRSPLMEWIFGGIGLALTLSMIGFIGSKAVTHPPAQPPDIEVRIDQVSRVGGGYAAQIVANNRSRDTAKGVEVEGVLSSPGSAESEMSSVTFDYIPGGSTVRGALYFKSDPASGELHLRTLGHTEP